MSMTQSFNTSAQDDVAPVQDASQTVGYSQPRGNAAAQEMLGDEGGDGGFHGGTHLIVPGDTLWGLARTYYGDGRQWTRIRDANPDTVHRGGDLIYVGDRLTIPTVVSTTDDDAGADTSVGGDQQATGCIDFSALDLDGLAELMAGIAAGTRQLDPVNRDGLLHHLETLSNDDYAVLVGRLDSQGNLFAFLNVTLYDSTDVQVDDAHIDTEVPVFCWRLWNADDRIDADVQRANEIYNQEGIGIIPVSERTITKGQAEAATGTTLDEDYSADTATTGADSEHEFSDDDFDALIQRFIPTTVIGGLWVKDFTRAGLFGISAPEFYFRDHYPKLAAISSATARDDTFAHEIGHILTDAGHRNEDAEGNDDPQALMHSGSGRDTTAAGDGRLNDAEVASVKSSLFSWTVDQCRI